MMLRRAGLRVSCRVQPPEAQLVDHMCPSGAYQLKGDYHLTDERLLLSPQLRLRPMSDCRLPALAIGPSAWCVAREDGHCVLACHGLAGAPFQARTYFASPRRAPRMVFSRCAV